MSSPSQDTNINTDNLVPYVHGMRNGRKLKKFNNQKHTMVHNGNSFIYLTFTYDDDTMELIILTENNVLKSWGVIIPFDKLNPKDLRKVLDLDNSDYKDEVFTKTESDNIVLKLTTTILSPVNVFIELKPISMGEVMEAMFIVSKIICSDINKNLMLTATAVKMK